MHDIPRACDNFLVLNFCTQGFLWGCFFGWKLEGGEQRIFPVNASVFLSIEMAYFFGTKS